MMPAAEKSKVKRSDQFRLWNGRFSTLRYGTSVDAEEVVRLIKELGNRTSRAVVVSKQSTPQGIVHSFSFDFRVRANGETYGQGKRASRWAAVSRVNGVVMPGEDYPTILEFTPERVRPSFIGALGFGTCIVLVLLRGPDISPTIRTPLLTVLVMAASLSFIIPMLFVSFGPGLKSLDQRVTDILLKIEAVKIDEPGADSIKPKRREARRPMIEDL